MDFIQSINNLIEFLEDSLKEGAVKDKSYAKAYIHLYNTLITETVREKYKKGHVLTQPQFKLLEEALAGRRKITSEEVATISPLLPDILKLSFYLKTLDMNDFELFIWSIRPY